MLVKTFANEEGKAFVRKLKQKGKHLGESESRTQSKLKEASKGYPQLLVERLEASCHLKAACAEAKTGDSI